MRIGELAERTGCTPETIRFYEAQGLLQPPARSDNNYRAYGEAHVARLHFVRRCRSLDLGHDEIRALIDLQDRPRTACGEVQAMLDRQADRIARRLDELLDFQRQLGAIRAACVEGACIGACGALDSLRRTTGPTAPVRERSPGRAIRRR